MCLRWPGVQLLLPGAPLRDTMLVILPFVLDPQGSIALHVQTALCSSWLTPEKGWHHEYSSRVSMTYMNPQEITDESSAAGDDAL